MVNHPRQLPRLTIARLMWSILIASLGLGVCRAVLLGDPEVRSLVSFILILLVGFPATALGISALARWAFTPIRRARVLQENVRRNPPPPPA